MNDVLILALNSKYIHSSLAPWYLKSAVADLDIECRVSEHTVNEDAKNVLAEILNFSPKILAISVYIWNVEYVFALLKSVKAALPDIITVLGGPEVSYNQKEVFDKSKETDYIISGEGERPFFELCKHLFFDKSVDLKGISYRLEEEIFVSNPYIGGGTPISPYSKEYFEALNGKISYFESSRGCPYSCAYCLSGRCEGMRFFDMEYVTENLILLANSGTKTIKFVDRTFNADRRRAIEIWKFIISGSGRLFPKDVCFHFELSGDLIDNETLDVIGHAPVGLFQFEIGIQSFCEKTIDSIHRVTKSDDLKHKISQLVSVGNSHIHTDLIAGLPYEGYEDFKYSFNEAYLLKSDMLQLGFLKILHGTELEDKADVYGLKFHKNPPYEVYETPWLPCEDIKKLKIVEKALDRLHNSGRFKRTIGFCMQIFNSPFDFFYEAGLATNSAVGLDNLTDVLYTFMCEHAVSRAAELRDIMVLDRLATNSSKKLPPSLYRSEPRLSVLKNQLNRVAETAERPSCRRSIALLYHFGKAVYVDYKDKNFKGEYRLNFVTFEVN